MNLSKEIDQHSQYIEKVALWVWLIGSPTLLFVGTLGSILSIIVMSRKRLQVSHAMVFLSALSVMDLLVLYTGLLRRWIKHLTGTDIRAYSSLSCKIHTWMVYGTLDISVWIIVLLTIERLISVSYPFSVKKYFTHKTCIGMTGAVSVVMLAINSHMIFGVVKSPSTKSNGTMECDFLTDSYKDFFLTDWAWIDLCVFSLVPLAIIIVSNTVIIWKLMGRHYMARRVVPSRNVTVNDLAKGLKLASRRVSSVTKILMGLTLMLLLTTLPISIFNIIFTDIPQEQEMKGQYELGKAVVNMLQYSNNAFHFVLYYLSSSRFRNELCNCARELNMTLLTRSEFSPIKSGLSRKFINSAQRVDGSLQRLSSPRNNLQEAEGSRRQSPGNDLQGPAVSCTHSPGNDLQGPADIRTHSPGNILQDTADCPRGSPRKLSPPSSHFETIPINGIYPCQDQPQTNLCQIRVTPS